LETFVQDKVGSISHGPFMAAPESAIKHLHSHGLAHNNLTSSNIMVNKEGIPVLIDFGECQPIGSHLKYIRGTPGWNIGE
jgi:serine/threonine protein kinase